MNFKRILSVCILIICLFNTVIANCSNFDNWCSTVGQFYDTGVTVFYVEDDDAMIDGNSDLNQFAPNNNSDKTSINGLNTGNNITTNISSDLLNTTIIQPSTTAIDLIEYDVVYTVTSDDNATSLNATFTVTNNESENKLPLLIAGIYDGGRMVNIQTVQPTISSGTTVNEIISIVVPEDKTESYYIKLFALEGTGSLRPLGKSKMVSDIDPYLREKMIYITATENIMFNIFMNSSTAKGVDGDVVHTIEYDTTKVEPVDLCSFTYEKEISETVIPNTNILIDSVDLENGIIKYKFLNNSGRNTGINNVIKFKSLTSITDAEIRYTIQ